MAASKPKKEVFEKTRGAFGKKGSLRRAFWPFTGGLASFAIYFIFVAVQQAQAFSALGGAKWFYGNKTPNRNFLPVKKFGAVKTHLLQTTEMVAEKLI